MKIKNMLILGIIALVPVVARAELTSSDTNVEQTKNEFKPYLSFRAGIGKFSKSRNFNIKDVYIFSGSAGFVIEDFNYEVSLYYMTNNKNLTDLNKPAHYGKDTNSEKWNRLVTESSITSYSLFANVYYNIDMNIAIVPYVGSGLGISKHYIRVDKLYYITYFNYEEKAWDERRKEGMFTTFKSKCMPAYQLVAGINFNVSNDVNLLIDYRYFSTFKALKPSDNNILNHFRNHSVNLGIKFIF